MKAVHQTTKTHLFCPPFPPPSLRLPLSSRNYLTHHLFGQQERERKGEGREKESQREKEGFEKPAGRIIGGEREREGGTEGNRGSAAAAERSLSHHCFSVASTMDRGEERRVSEW